MISKHSPGPRCQGCDAKLIQVHSHLVAWFNARKAVYPDMHVCYGFRSKAEQDQCVAAGASKLRFPTSKHNRMVATDPTRPMHPELWPALASNADPESAAIDVFQIQAGKAVFSMKFYRSLAADCMGYPITWGGFFKRLVDGPHFELTLEGLAI